MMLRASLSVKRAGGLGFVVLVVILVCSNNKSTSSSQPCNDTGKLRNLKVRHANANIGNTDSAADLTVIVTDFEDWDNRLANVTDQLNNILRPLPNIWIIGEQTPYPPPFGWRRTIPSNVKVLSTGLLKGYLSVPSIREPPAGSSHYLFLPDNTFVHNRVAIDQMIAATRAIDVDVDHNDTRSSTGTIAMANIGDVKSPWCVHMEFDVKRWTLNLYSEQTETDHCNYAMGRIALLIPHQTLQLLQWAQLRPTAETILVQAARLGIDVKTISSTVAATSFRDGPNPLYADAHKQSKRSHAVHMRLTHLYNEIGVKLKTETPKAIDPLYNNQKVYQNNYQNKKDPHDLEARVAIKNPREAQYFGCNAQTTRCFGTIHNDVPSYLVEGRWTPPCCLRNLRTTAAHVFQRLDACHARYWLEGGSLLGAARSGDIIPWDYDVDVGIHTSDVDSCRELKLAAAQGRYTTAEGFVWERATEGGFFRVQFSVYNHLHVDIFPFFENQGQMDRANKMKAHRQDREFPMAFINPLSRISFMGLNVSAPNRHTEFLELKFGKGAIENPQCPHGYTQD
eukprot:m.98604 g.98604  ORF g.98604 m.98604 type:complete len:566 (-) comp27083_c0_seq1:27-1724(-)